MSRFRRKSLSFTDSFVVSSLWAQSEKSLTNRISSRWNFDFPSNRSVFTPLPILAQSGGIVNERDSKPLPGTACWTRFPTLLNSRRENRDNKGMPRWWGRKEKFAAALYAGRYCESLRSCTNKCGKFERRSVTTALLRRVWRRSFAGKFHYARRVFRPCRRRAMRFTLFQNGSFSPLNASSAWASTQQNGRRGRDIKPYLRG